MTNIYLKIKSFLDIFFASFLLILFLPLLSFVSLILFFNYGSPVLFTQQRPGLFGKPFKLFKFRTMSNARDTQGNLLPESERLTSLGIFLRSTSIDELPTLFNILKGDMSFVGPRPLLVEYLPFYSSYHSHRHDVKPGLSGWAQINGRNSISWKQKFDFDIWYVNNISFFLDLRILLVTIFKVLKRDGINHSSRLSMPKFTGYD